LLQNLSPLDAIVPVSSISSFADWLDTSVNVVLGGLTVVYNRDESYLQSGSLILNSTFGWSWAGGLLELWEIDLNLNFMRDVSTDPIVLNGSVSGTIGVAGAQINVSANKPVSGAHWTFRGELADELTIDFADLVSSLIPGVSPPDGNGFPSSLTFIDAQITVVPDTGQLDFYTYSLVPWTFQIGSTSVGLSALGAEVHIAPGSGTRTATIASAFTLGAIQGIASIALGSGTTDFIVTCLLAIGQQTSASAMVNGTIAANTWGSVSVPSGFTLPDGIAKATILVNLTQKTLLMQGTYSPSETGSARYAAMALLIKDVSENSAQMGFLVGAALGKWTLSDISPALAGIDAVIGLQLSNAAVVVSTLNETIDAAVTDRITVLPAGMALQPGLNFSVELDFTQGLLRNVSAIVALTGPYKLAGYIPSDTVAPVTLSASLGSLTLLSFLSFQNVELVFSNTPSTPPVRTLNLNGGIVAHLDQDYTFNGSLAITDTSATFAVVTAQSVAHPLGLPGITLNALGFEIEITYTGIGQTGRSSMAFNGSVTIDSATTLKALVGVSNGTASLVLIQLLQANGQPASLSVASLFHQATGLPWPTVADIGLSNGNLSWVPGTESVSWQAVDHAPGFQIAAQASILFLPEVSIAATVITNAVAPARNGLTAQAQFTNPIDWNFIRFTGTAAHGGPTAGPYVSIDTRSAEAQFGLGAGITLLSVDIGDVDIIVESNSMTGTLTLPAGAGIFAGQQISFAWANDQFTIENWPMQNLALPDFELTDITGAEPYSQTIIDSLPISTKFNLTTAMSITPPGTGAATLNITFTGSFSLQAVTGAYSGSDSLIEAQIASTTLHIPFPTVTGGYRWSDLADALVQAIKNAGTSIIQNLLDDPVNLAKLTAIAGVQWSVSNAAAYLKCRGMSEDAAADAANAASSSSVSEVSAPCAGGAAIAVGGLIATIVNGTVTNQGQQPQQGQPVPSRPSTPVLSCDGTSLTIDWSGSSTQNVSNFGVSLQAGGGAVVPVSAVSSAATSVPVPVAQLTFGQTYTATVVASGPGGRSPASGAGSLYLLTTPVIVSLQYAASILTATWQPVNGSADYAVIVNDHTGVALSPAAGVQVSGTTAHITHSAFQGGGQFEVQISGTAAREQGPWSSPSSISISLLPAPVVTVMTVGSQLEATWRPVTGAASYQVHVLNAAGSLLSPQPQIVQPAPTAAGCTATISGGAMLDGTQIIVSVQGVAANSYGAPCLAPVFVTILGAPTITGTIFNSSQHLITASWNSVPRATHYAAEVRNSRGVALASQPAFSISGLTATIATVLSNNAGQPQTVLPARALAENATYQIAVQPSCSTAIGLWATQSVTLTDQLPPVVTLTMNPANVNPQQQATVVATVTGSVVGITPTGTISFEYTGAQSPHGAVLNTASLSAGSASMTQLLPPGQGALSAAYSGDSNYVASTSPPLGIIVTGIVPSLSVSGNPATSITGGPVVLLVAVSGPSGSPAPSGGVTFSANSVQIGSANVVSGSASLTVSHLPVGTSSITASYSGDANYNSGMAAAAQVAVVPKQVPTVSCSVGVATIQPGTMVPLTATVTSPIAGYMPGGSVIFRYQANGAANPSGLASEMLSGGIARTIQPAATIGQGAYSVSYIGDAFFTNGVSPDVPVSVDKFAASVQVSTLPPGAVQGSPIAITAMFGIPMRGLTPTGTVIFTSDGTQIGTAVLASSIATLSVRNLPVGTHSIVVSYPGDSSFKPVTSSPVRITITS
jgi:hypothetical protein